MNAFMKLELGAAFLALVVVVLVLVLVRRGRAHARRAARLERQLVAIDIQCRAMRMHPHFVFNALHAIVTLIDVRPDDAKRMLARLGDLLRTTVEFMETAEVPLTREIEWIEQYVEVQQIRYEERLEIDVELAPEAVRAMVPPLVLQPLVENSIKHGVEKRAGGGRIAIAAERIGDTLRLRVRDDGPGPDATSGAGVGLGSTRARLTTMYGPSSSVTLRAADGGGAEAIVEMPFREGAV
jgi:LytS/YehU family sensor histidine kinase